jgi:hypothetical protein
MSFLSRLWDTFISLKAISFSIHHYDHDHVDHHIVTLSLKNPVSHYINYLLCHVLPTEMPSD